MASDELARSFAGKSARSRDLRTRASASSRRVRLNSHPSGPPRPSNALVDRAGRRLARARWKHEDDPVVLRERERRERGPVSLAQLRPLLEEERHVGADSGRELCQPGRGERTLQRGVREPQRGCRVGAPAAETGSDGNLLRQAHRPAGLDTRCLREQRQCGRDRRVVRETCDPRPARQLQRHPVGEIDALQDRRHLVHAVIPPGPDHQREIELGRRRRACHASSRANARNSAGGSSSALVACGRLRAPRTRSTSERLATPLSSIEFGSVLRRWAKAASTTHLT